MEKEKFSFVFRKVFFFYFEWKTLSRNYEKFKNILLFFIILNLILKLLIVIFFVLNPF
jgi:hypothetical protein